MLDTEVFGLQTEDAGHPVFLGYIDTENGGHHSLWANRC